MATLKEGSEQAAVASKRTWTGPRGQWLFGCLPEIRKSPLTFYRETWRTYGDLVRIPTLPGVEFYLLADPAAIEHVLVKNHKNYRKPKFLTNVVRLFAGNGLFTSEGNFWLRQRRLAQPAFLRGPLMRLAVHMTAAADGLIREWEAAADGRTVDIGPEMMRLVLRITGTTLFGADIGGEADAIAAAYQPASAFIGHKLNHLVTIPLWVPTRRNRAFRHFRALLDRIVLQLIETRRQSGTVGNDLLGLLLSARDEESGTGMSDQQLKEEVLTLLFAGYDTTGAALTWAWYLLARHPEVQETLHDEVSAHLGGRTPTADDLPRLPLATAVFEEALRLYPPAPGLARQALERDEILGYPVRAGALLMPSQWVMHRHPAYWDEPDAFRPERFLPGRAKARPKFAYFPFGGGPRACIGNTFAATEGALVLAALAQRFQLLPADERPVELDTTFTLRPKGAVNLVVRKRS